MNKASCCNVTTGATRNTLIETADGNVHPSSIRQRRFTLARFSLPTLILVLLPKCPACFAAYLALGTGISVSMATASVLRTLLLGICVSSLVWIFASAFRSALMNRLHPDSHLY